MVLNRCYCQHIIPWTLLCCCCCAFTTFTRLAFAWLALKRAGTRYSLSQNTYLLSIAHEIKSTSRYKAYWFLGKWALNIHYYYLISNTSNWLYLLLICCTTTLLSIFYYLFSMYTAFVPVAMYIWCALKCQLLTILPSNIVFPAAFATAAKDFLLPLGKNCKLYYYKQVQQQHHPFIFHNYYINIRTTYMHAMVCHLNKDHPQVVYYYFSLPRLT